jgi:UV DNA damage repair endonuclease
MGTFDVEQVPQFEEIKEALMLAGDLARLHDQRLTFHPRWLDLRRQASSQPAVCKSSDYSMVAHV